MNALFASLQTVSFVDYDIALRGIRNRLDVGDRQVLTQVDFLYLLRPYCWYLHDPGFQDIIDVCEAAMKVFMKYENDLMEDTNPILGNEFIAVGTFLANYLDTGKFDNSGWKMLFGSPEIATSISAKKYAEKLTELGKPQESIDAFNALNQVMSKLEGAKHITYWCLRHVAADNLDYLKVMHSFPPGDQSYILHALDAFPGNAEVIQFYNTFIEKTPYEVLKTEAKKYLETM